MSLPPIQRDLCGRGCGGTLIPYSANVRRCDRCGTPVADGAAADVITDLAGNAIVMRARVGAIVFLQHAMEHAELLVGVCAACAKDDVLTLTSSPRSSEGMPGGLSHSLCPYHEDVMRYEGGLEPSACWACSSDPAYSSAPWSRCRSCLAKAEAAKARAQEEAEAKRRADDAEFLRIGRLDVEAVHAGQADQRHLEFEKSMGRRS